jgi:hypothetical protein
VVTMPQQEVGDEGVSRDSIVGCLGVEGHEQLGNFSPLLREFFNIGNRVVFDKLYRCRCAFTQQSRIFDHHHHIWS